MSNEILMLIIAYLIGSIPFGLVFSYCCGYGDIRKIGSGNIGTTNVLRTGSKFLALITLIADSGKVILAIILSNKFGFHIDYFIASAAFIGHLFPIWLKFKGGKGIASFFGLSLYLFPEVALIALLSWIITFILFRYSSLSGIVACFVTMAALCYINQISNQNLYLVLFLILLIIIKHKDNIIRLINGQETKFKKT